MSTTFTPPRRLYEGMRIANGPDASRAAHGLMLAQQRRDAWPYPDLFPQPKITERRNPEGYIVANAQGAANQAVVLTFAVPSGFKYVLQQLLMTVWPSNTFAPGSYTFSIDRDTPLTGGALQGSPLADWNSIGFGYGSLEFGWVRLARPEVFAPEEVIRVKVINNSVGVGAPNTFLARFDGYLLPSIGE